MSNIQLTGFHASKWDETSLEESTALFEKLSVKSDGSGQVPKREANGEFFDENFPGGLLDRPNYSHCVFNGSTFDVPNASYSQFSDCSFIDCDFYNGDFRYSDWNRVTISGSGEGDEATSVFNRGNFAFSSLKSTRFSGIAINGVTFRQALMRGCTFDNVSIMHTVFEHIDFEGSTFVSTDFRYAGVRYCQFTGATFKNVTFPILDICNNFGLIDILRNSEEEVRLSTGADSDVPLEDALVLLPKLAPYYRRAGLYFCLLNLLHVYGMYDELEGCIPEAIERTIKENDFEALLNVCELLVEINRLDSSQLKGLYKRIDSLINPDELPYHLKMSYLNYMDRIRDILVVNPQRLPAARIVFKTAVPPEEPDRLFPLIAEIIEAFDEHTPGLNPEIAFSHHSDFDIIANVVGSLPQIVLICQFFYYALGGTKTLLDLSGTMHETIDEIPENAASYKIESELHRELSIGPIRFAQNDKTRKLYKGFEYHIDNKG